MNLDWGNLGFKFLPTRANVRFAYRDGKWDSGKLSDNYDLQLNIVSNCLHYGQAIFEGLKAFRNKDGKVRIFRPEENAKRLNRSARQLMMAEFPVDQFVDAVKTLVNENIDYVPPYGSGGSLYIRPVMFGTSPQIGVNASEEYMLIFIAVPVGPYYKGAMKPVDACISTEYDRAAPRGTGHVKAAGNYAASLYSAKLAKERGCAVALFLDPQTHRYIDEFGTSNFLALTRDGKYVTPKSESILPSITNKSLMQLAEDLGYQVEQRKVEVGELADFAEVAACGTAVVLTPVGKIFYGDQLFDYGDEIGPGLKKLYERMTQIQYGEYPDEHNWMVEA